MDEQTSDLLVQYFKNSIDANKEIVKQLGSFNENNQEILRKVLSLSENIEDLYTVIQETFKNNQELVKSLSNEQKAQILNAITDSKDETKENLKEYIGNKNNQVTEFVKEVNKKIGELPESQTLSLKIGSVKDEISDFKRKLIAIVTLTVSLVTMFVNLIIKLVELYIKHS